MQRRGKVDLALLQLYELMQSSNEPEDRPVKPKATKKTQNKKITKNSKQKKPQKRPKPCSSESPIKSNMSLKSEDIDASKISWNFSLFIAEKNCRAALDRLATRIFYKKWQARLRRTLLMKLKKTRENRKQTTNNLQLSPAKENFSFDSEQSATMSNSIDMCQARRQAPRSKPQIKKQKQVKKREETEELDETLEFLIHDLNKKSTCFFDDAFSSYSSNTMQSQSYAQTTSQEQEQSTNSGSKKGVFGNTFSEEESDETFNFIDSDDDMASLQSTGIATYPITDESYDYSTESAAIEDQVATTATYNLDEQDEQEEEEDDNSKFLSPKKESSSSSSSSDSSNSSYSSDSDEIVVKKQKKSPSHEAMATPKKNDSPYRRISLDDDTFSEGESMTNEYDDDKREKEKENEPMNNIDSISGSNVGQEKKEQTRQSSEKLYDTDDIVITSTVNDSISTSEFRVPYSTTEAKETSEELMFVSTTSQQESNPVPEEEEEAYEEETFQFSDSFEEAERVPTPKAVRAKVPKPTNQQAKSRFKDPIFASKDYIAQFAVSSSEFSTDEDLSWRERRIPLNHTSQPKQDEGFNVFEDSSESDKTQTLSDNVNVAHKGNYNDTLDDEEDYYDDDAF